MAKGGGGKALTGILCFIIGFIVGLAAELAVIVAGVFWLLYTDIDNIFNIAGVENTTTDDEGNVSYVYVNTSEVSNLYQLIAKLNELYGKGTDTLTLNDLENILPISDALVDAVYVAAAGMLGDEFTEDYVRELIDEETLKSTAIANLGGYIKDCMLSMEVSKALAVADIDVESNALYMALAYGAQAGTVTINGEIKVLYSVTLTVDDTEEDNGEQNGEQNQAASYKLTDEPLTEGGEAQEAEEEETVYYLSDGTVLDSSYNDYVSNLSGYKLYLYVDDDAKAYVVQRNDYGSEEDYSLVYTEGGDLLEYTEILRYASLSGGYYYDDEGSLVILTTKTLNDITSGGIDSMYDDVYITDLMGEDADETLLKALYGITLGALMNGDASLDDIMEKVNIPDVMDASADNAIMAFVAYSLTGLTDEAIVTEVSEGETVTTYPTINVDGEDISYRYSATLHMFDEDSTTYTAYVVVDESGKISSVWYEADGVLTEYAGISVADIDIQIDRLMDTLAVGDMIDTEGSTMLEAIAGSTINSLSEDIQNLTLQELFYDQIYDNVLVYDTEWADGKITLADGTTEVEIDAYLKVVYENLETRGGTYYLATSRTYEIKVAELDGQGDPVLDGQGNQVYTTVSVTEITITRQSYSYGDSTLESDIGKTTTGTEDVGGTDIDVTYEYAVYWSEDGTTLYEVTKFNAKNLYLIEDSNGVEYVQYNYEYVYDDNGDIVYDSETGEPVHGNVILGRLTDYSQYTGDGLLFTYGTSVGAWYFMLCEADDSGEKHEYTYTIDEMGSLITNTTYNIEHATLNELVENHMLTSDTLSENLTNTTISGAVLNTVFNSTDYDNRDYTLGELTLFVVMDVFVWMLGQDSIQYALNQLVQ